MRRARRHPALLVAAVAAMAVGSWLAGVGPASAAISSATPSPTAVAAAPDFATATYGDAWDYANVDDFGKPLESWMVGASNVSMAGGMLSFDMTTMGQLPLVRGFGDITIPWGRDGSLNSIDAGTYTRLSLRMNAQISQTTTGQVVWMNCGNFIAACHGGQPLTVRPGWNTYDIVLQNQYSNLPAAWAGQIHSLVVLPIGGNLTSGHIDLDWARLYQPGPTVAVDLVDSNPGGQISASWTATPTTADYVSNANRSAVFATTTSTATTRVNFNAAAFPAGSYRFFGTDTDGSTSPLGGPLTVTAAAATSRLLADASAGSDYASAVRGDAWDFSQPGDVKSSNEALLSFDGQLLHGRNGPNQNDPWVELAVNAPIDGNRFTRLSVRMFFDGAFSLADAPGGGMNARIYWGTVGSPAPQVGQDILVYPGWQTITFDLSTPKLYDEGASSRRGWVGQQIDWFRIDPNEDRGVRTWAVDWVRLGNMSPFGSFDAATRAAGGIAVAGWAIDPDTAGPTEVHVYVDGAGYNLGGAAGARPDVGAAYPTHGSAHGFTAVVPAGAGVHHVCAFGINQGPGGHTLLGCRDVVVDPKPFGSFDLAARNANGIRVAGWAIDGDTANPIEVHVYVGSLGYNLGNVAAARADVGAAYPSYGPNHGFDTTVPASAAPHDVCAFAINSGPGGHTLLGCRRVA